MKLFSQDGIEFDVPIEILENLYPVGSPQQGMQVAQTLSGGGAGVHPIKTYEERQIEVFLEHTHKPQRLQEFFWALDPILALIKVTDKQERYVMQLRIENIIRAFIIENKATLSLSDIEQLEFYSLMQSDRSITFDGKPNERELWTLQQIHQRVEQIGGGQTPGSALESIKRFLGGNRGGGSPRV